MSWAATLSPVPHMQKQLPSPLSNLWWVTARMENGANMREPLMGWQLLYQKVFGSDAAYGSPLSFTLSMTTLFSTLIAPSMSHDRGTPTSRSTWLVPMQKQPIASRRRAALRASSVTCILLRIPSTCTSFSFSVSSSSVSAPGTVSCNRGVKSAQHHEQMQIAWNTVCELTLTEAFARPQCEQGLHIAMQCKTAKEPP